MSSPVQTDDVKKQPKVPAGFSGSAVKEKEPVGEVAMRAEEEKLMAEIKTTAETADRQALEAIQKSISEVKRGQFEPELPPDVEDAGVYNPAKAAEDVVKNGPTIDVGTSENIYKKGLSSKISAKSDDKKNVVGATSLAALALWIGRLLKMAHKHTMRVVFRKGDK